MHLLSQLLQKGGLFLFFLLLQAISLYLLNKQTNLRESAIGAKLVEINGSIHDANLDVKEYFQLREKNQKLRAANIQLQKELKNLKNKENLPPAFSKTDSTKENTIYKYDFIPVKIVNNSLVKKKNYLTINRGKKSGIQKGMGVISDYGVIGIVKYVSDNYARVQSLLHSDTRVNAQLKGNYQFGTMIWDGESPEYVYLKDLSRFTKTKKNDTIETYGGRSIFPRFHPIGVIDTVTLDKVSGNSNIKVKLFEDFTKLQTAYVVKNIDYEEIKQLEALTEEEEE